MEIIEKMMKESNAPKYIAVFVDWYMRKNDKNRESWADLVRFTDCPEFHDNGKAITERYAEQNWLATEAAQSCIQVYMKANKTATMQKIYSEMVSKALSGDVRAATWVSQFHESEFFDTTNDDINAFLNAVNIPKIEKGKRVKKRGDKS